LSFDYAASRATADRLIARFGGAMTLSRPGATSGDAWNPVVAAASDHAIVAVEIDEGRAEGEVLTNRRTLLVAAGEGIVPAVGDTIDGAEVIEVKPLSPAAVDVLYTVRLSR
jgi:hypothetical protein